MNRNPGEAEAPTYKRAIIRRPCPEMVDGITTAGLGVPDYSLAMEQHKNYEKVLKNLGLEVTVLEGDSRFPDSVFVEDVALCTNEMAVVTAPGAASRQGEEIEMGQVLHTFYDNVERIDSPGTLDAGDVMMVGSHFFIGCSDRTNQEGAEQLIRILEKYGMTGEMVKIGDVLHLKTAVSYLEHNTLLVTDALIDHPAFKDFDTIRVPKGEEYAANAIWINGSVLLADGFKKTYEKLNAAGYQVIVLPVTEFEKLDGGLSCLSLRF